MVSYSWSGQPSEQVSAHIVSEVVSLFPCCWWDRERLLPGSPVQELCLQAARDCTHAFVFVSRNYMRSKICQQELETLRHTPGKVSEKKEKQKRWGGGRRKKK